MEHSEEDEEYVINVLDCVENVLLMINDGEFIHGTNDRRRDILDIVHRCFEYILLLEDASNDFHLLLQSLRQLILVMEPLVEFEPARRGRTRIQVEQEQLIFLVESGFRVKDIADIFHCSKRTIERRMNELSIAKNDYSSICDSDLDSHVSSILIHRQVGEKMVLGQLKSQGIFVQRQRIRESIRRVDPIGVQLRQRTVLRRRMYAVRSPNSLWHLDGYHKLIRWNFVIHGAIDGYSRLITYLKVSPNNSSQSVLTAFCEVVEEYGIPSRIRIDRGGENMLVTRWMLEHPLRGLGRHSVISGRSVHNQRIERLWRDLFSGCICYFYSFFYYLEDVGILDKDDIRDKYALHFVFLPVIQQQLHKFREGWAHHSLRTMNNRTPFQLWVLGLSHANETDPNCSEINGLSEDDAHMYGVDFDSPSSVSESNLVQVDDLPPCLTDEHMTHLQALIPHIDVLTDEWMISSYAIAKAYVYQHCSRVALM